MSKIVLAMFLILFGCTVFFASHIPEWIAASVAILAGILILLGESSWKPKSSGN